MENTEETNALIRQFMGYKKCTRCENCGMVTRDGKGYESEKYLTYHSDWNLLKQVIYKIYSMKGYSDAKEWKAVTMMFASDPIGNTYQAVIQFINYYNGKS